MKQINEGVLAVLHHLPGELRDEINRDRIEELFAKLSKKQQEILKMRFGLDGYERHTQQEIADKLGVTQQAVDYHLKKLQEVGP